MHLLKRIDVTNPKNFMAPRCTVRASSVVLLIIIGFLLGGNAVAAEGDTWLPAFEPGKAVHVDSKISEHEEFPLRLDGLESQLNSLQSRHGLRIYVVATQQGADIPPGTSKMAVGKLDDLILKWSGAPDFPAANYLVILWVRSSTDPLKGSVAVNSGSALRDHGLDRSYFDNPSGPVVASLKRNMPQDPRGAFIAIVEAVNAEIDASKAREQSRIESEAFWSIVPLYATGAIATMVLLVVLVVCFSNRYRWKRRLEGLVNEWQSKLESASKMLSGLSSSYAGFMSEQSDWRERFSGETRNTYCEALESYADFITRQRRAQEILDEARSKLRSTPWYSGAALRQGIEILTSRPVTVSSEDLPLEQATLFGGLVRNAEYTPAKLLDSMSELFDKVNSQLGSIVKAFESARTKRKVVESILSDVESDMPLLEQCGLPVSPFAERVEGLRQRLFGIMETLNTDPLRASAESLEIESASRGLHSDIERAVKLKSSYEKVSASRQDARKDVERRRSTVVEYAFPLAAGETAAPESFFLVNNKVVNPDELLENADLSVKRALVALEAAQLDEAQSQLEGASRAISSIHSLFSTHLKCKLLIENDVPSLRRNRASLADLLVAARDKVARLEPEFADACLVTVRQRLDEAERIESEYTASMLAIKQGYDSQHYEQAHEAASVLSERIQKAKASAEAVAENYDYLLQVKTSAKETLHDSNQRMHTLAESIRVNDFVVGDATVRRAEAARRKLAVLEESISGVRPHWQQILDEVKRLDNDLQVISVEVDKHSLTYKQAVSAVDALESEIRLLKSELLDHRVLPSRKDLLQDSLFVELPMRIQRRRSDWSSIKGEAEKCLERVKTTRERVADDIRKFEQASTSTRDAMAQLAHLESKDFGYGIRAETSTSRRHLEVARVKMSVQDYDGCISECELALKAIRSASSRAVDEADTRRNQLAAAAAAAVVVATGSRNPAARANTTPVRTNSGSGSTGGPTIPVSARQVSGERKGGGNAGGGAAGGADYGSSGSGGADY